jgi:hypothetical protein
MPPSEPHVLAERLARMKKLVDALEKACSESQDQQALFLKLKKEMASARAALKPHPPPRSK